MANNSIILPSLAAEGPSEKKRSMALLSLKGEEKWQD